MFTMIFVLISMLCSLIISIQIENQLQSGIMADYNITKIVDGLFISDQNVAFDGAFLAGNKVIRMLGWIAEPFYHSLQEEGIQQYIMTKNVMEVKFPSFEELQQGFSVLQIIHQEMLCGLIYSQSQLQASLICIMYLMRRYRWDHSTAYEFMRSKMEMFECSEQTLDQLLKYQEYLIATFNTKLGHILWHYQFLIDYQSSSDDEMLLITTIKNKIRGDRECGYGKGQKKTRRIRWQDQLRPSSPFSINSSKNIAKSSIIKGRLASPSSAITFSNKAIQQQVGNKELQLLYQSVNFKPVKVSTKKQQLQNTWQENSQYQQLKEMSRTNFNDHRYMSSKVRRRGSLKPKTSTNVHKNNSSTNIQSSTSLAGIYGSRVSKGLSKVSSAQSFLTGLRSFNKMSINNS